MARPKARVAPPVLAKLRAICRSLPESFEEPAWVGTRWKIRARTFAHVLAIDDGWPPVYAKAVGQDGPVTVLTFRSSGFLYDTLRSAGPPFFHAAWGTLWGTKVIGMTLGKRVDWEEVAVVVTESYRLLAPAKLAAAVAPSRTTAAAGPAVSNTRKLRRR
jgi:hypothetical protein